jgi:hypothetical protein
MRTNEIFRLSTEPENLYVVKLREKFNYETNNTDDFTAAVAAAGNSGWVDLVNLEPRKSPPELVQMVMGFEDGFDYYVKYPSGTNIHGVNKDKDVGFINSERSPELAPNEDYECWMTYGWYPSVNAKNHTAYSDTPKLVAEGYKYTFRVPNGRELAAVKAGKRAVRFIQMGGVAQQEGS